MSGLFVKAAVRPRYKDITDITHVRPGGISEISGFTDSAKKKKKKIVTGSNMWGADVSRLAAQLNARV